MSAKTKDDTETGEFLLANVYESHLAFPERRRIRERRIFRLLPKSETHAANHPRIGVANAGSARMLLGTVPVEADGSVRFRFPALKPLAAARSASEIAPGSGTMTGRARRSPASAVRTPAPSPGFTRLSAPSSAGTNEAESASARSPPAPVKCPPT